MEKEAMEVLLETLLNLSSLYEMDDNQIVSFYKSFKDIYSNNDFRHSYAELSHFAEEQITPDSREELVSHLDLILSYADENFCEDREIIKKIGKLADHLELENLRLARIEQIKIISNTVSTEKAQTEILINDNASQIQKQQEEIKNMNTQMVSVLGIFSAVVLAFSGGMSYFSSTFSNLHNMPLYKTLLMASIMGLVLFNTVYILLKFIISINRFEHAKLGKGSSRTVFFINIILIITFVASLVMWLIDFCPSTETNYINKVSISSNVDD